MNTNETRTTVHTRVLFGFPVTLRPDTSSGPERQWSGQAILFICQSDSVSGSSRVVQRCPSHVGQCPMSDVGGHVAVGISDGRDT